MQDQRISNFSWSTKGSVIARSVWLRSGLTFLAVLLGAVSAGAIPTCPLTGAGTTGSPYLVATYADLDSIGSSCSLAGTYRLTADIDASASDTENAGHGLTPIGSGALAFTGTFHGAGHTISNLFINDSTDSAVGLFAILASGTIDSLAVDGSYFLGGAVVDSPSLGSLVGINAGGTILHCRAMDDTLSDTQDSAAVGGLVGRNRGPVSDCQAGVVATAGMHGFAGGIAGENRDTIRTSRASGSVSALDSTRVGGVAGFSKGSMSYDTADVQVSADGNWTFVGGLVGYMEDSLQHGVATGSASASGFGASVGGAVGFVDTFGYVGSVWATGAVSGTDSAQNMGGLVGYSRDSAAGIRDCWATGNVTGISSSNLGGLLGSNDLGANVVSCYATGNVTGTYKSNTGGLVGQNNGLVDRCYATGKVVGSGTNAGVGGVVGWNQTGHLMNSYSTGHLLCGVQAGDTMWIGGVVGANADTVQNVYFAGRIDTFSQGGLIHAGAVAGASDDGITQAYWDTVTSGLGVGFGVGSTTGPTDTAIGLGAAQMLDGSNFIGFTFDPDTGWKITLNKTCPALSGLANAPFAFSDSLLMDSTGLSLPRLVGNDADADTSTPSLVAVVDSVLTGNLTSFAASTPGRMDTLIYRVGAVVSPKDTLWGGVAEATLELVSFHFALGADSLHHYGDAAFTISAAVNPSFPAVFASQNATVATVTGAQVQPIKPGSATLTATLVTGLVETSALRIAPANLTITGASAQNKVYDGTTAATVTGAVLSSPLGSDTVTLVPGTWAFSSKDTGTAKPVVLSGASLSGAQAADYALTLPTVTANITAKPLTISGAVAQNKVYDGTTAATVTGDTLLGKVTGDAVTLNLGTATFDTKYVGTGKTVTVGTSSISGAGATNYSLTQLGTLTANIVPDTVHVTAEADSVPEGQPDPVFGYTSSALIGTDVLSGKLSRVAGSAVGNYAITLGTLSADSNYAIVFTSATFKILKNTTTALASLPMPEFSPVLSHELATNVGQAFAPPAIGSGRAELGTGPVSGGQSAQTVDILLTGPGTVSVAIYDNLGTLVISFSRDIAQMDLNYLEATKDGRWILPLSWNLRAENGIAVPTGVYLWKIDVQTVDGKKLDTVKRLGVREIR